MPLKHSFSDTVETLANTFSFGDVKLEGSTDLQVKSDVNGNFIGVHASTLIIEDSSTGNTITLSVPVLSGDYDLKLPESLGTQGQFISLGENGQLEFSSGGITNPIILGIHKILSFDDPDDNLDSVQILNADDSLGNTQVSDLRLTNNGITISMKDMTENLIVSSNGAVITNDGGAPIYQRTYS